MPSGNDLFEGISRKLTDGTAGADFGSDPLRIHSENGLLCWRINWTRTQPFLISSTPTRGVQHLQVRIDAVDHAERFSVDFDQCPSFAGKVVTPLAEYSFCHIEFLFAVCESTVVSFTTAFVREVTWVEPHRWLLVVVTEIPFGVEWNVHVPHVDHWFDDPSFESAWGVEQVHVQHDQLSV